MSETGDSLRLRVTAGPEAGQMVMVEGDRFTIGRGDDADLTLTDPEASRRHAEIRRTADGSGFEIEDLGSRNGVIVNGQRTSGPTQLRSGDEVKIGDSTLSVVQPGAETRFGGGETKIAEPKPVRLQAADGPARGNTLDVTRERAVIGRDASSDLTIADEEVSRQHSAVQLQSDGSVEITDLGSRNGTFVDGKKIEGPTLLRGGEKLGIGQSSFDVQAIGQAGSETATRQTVREPAKPAPIPSEGPTIEPIKKPQTPSGVQRVKLQRSVTLATVLAGVAILAVVVVGVLAATGAFEGSSPKSAADIVAQAKPSTVFVIARQDGRRHETGTGWVYDANRGLIVTNSHVVDGGDIFQVGVGDELRTARVVGVSPCNDLAVLKLNGTQGLKTLPLGSQSELQQGDRVFALGFPGNGTINDELQVTEGTISAVKTREDLSGAQDPNFIVYPNVLQTDAAINPGNSGGPSINDDDELIGVNTLGSTGTQNQNYAIGVDQVKKVVPQLATGNSIGWAGFGFTAATNEQADQIGRGGLFVQSVVKDSNAAQANIQEGDFILQINGQDVETRQDYCNAVETVQSGETVPILAFGAGVGEYRLRLPFQ